MDLRTRRECCYIPGRGRPGATVPVPATDGGPGEVRCCKLCTIACPANVLELFGDKAEKKVRVKENGRGCISCNNCH